MGINHALIRDRFEDILESLERLESIGAIPKEEFLTHRDLRDLACYRLLIAIEAALQICFHISTHYLRSVPEDYAGCFVLLEQAGVISEELSRNLQRMARFRNLLVHRYWDIDYGQVYDLLHTRLTDLREFMNAVSRLL